MRSVRCGSAPGGHMSPDMVQGGTEGRPGHEVLKGSEGRQRGQAAGGEHHEAGSEEGQKSNYEDGIVCWEQLPETSLRLHT